MLQRGGADFSQAELLVLQSASRPSFKFEEPEMHHNQEVAYFAGKQSWDPVTMVWYDVQQNPDVSAGIYYWIETVVAMDKIQVSSPSRYKKMAQLDMIDGAGNVSETWKMYGTWPQTCNWQELDYTSTDLQTIEATMRYDRAIRACVSIPSDFSSSPVCPPPTTTT